MAGPLPSADPDELLRELNVPRDLTPVFSFDPLVTTIDMDAHQMDPYALATLKSTRGFLLVLTGTQRNQRLAYDRIAGAVAMHDLLIRAPSGTLRPMVGRKGLGKVFGLGFKWRYRHKNSQTGEVSGMSPLPTVKWNMGDQTGNTDDWVGETAFHQLPGVNQATTGVDTFQLFRNTSQQTEVFYLVDEKPNPGVGSTVDFTDNVPDEELVLAQRWTLDSSDVNPAYDEGTMPPLAKAYIHPNGRTEYFGVLRMAPYRTGTITVTRDSQEVTFAAGPGLMLSSREGQRLRLLKTSGAATIDDSPDLRISEVTSSTTAFVVPPVPDMEDMASGILAGATFEIVDDRDGRLVYMSEPSRPTQIDVLKAITIGFDMDEILMDKFALGGITHAITNRRIYRITEDLTERPDLTLRVERAAEEGMSGMWAGAVTPFGYVFVNDQGVRRFDGTGFVQALGASTPFEEFLPKLQFGAWEPSLRDQAYVAYDPEVHRVHVAFVPRGGSARSREFVFDPEAGVWRGVWRRRFNVAGFLRSTSGDDRFVFGDDHGNLYYDSSQTLDGVRWEAVDDPPLDGAIGTKDSFSTFTVASGDYDPDTDQRLVGMPILLEKADGTYQINWIADVPTTTQIVLQEVPDEAIVAGRRFLIGWIDWSLKTASVDTGEPVFHEDLLALRLRHKTPTSATDQTLTDDGFEVEVSADEGDFKATDTTDRSTVLKRDTWTNVRVDRGGRSFQVRMAGRSKQQEPQITQVIADYDLTRGRGE